MKQLGIASANVVICLYILFRSAVTFAIMPLTTSLTSRGGIYFVSLTIFAIGIAIFSWTERRGLASALAAALMFIALLFWWIVISKITKPIWVDLEWLVVPEIFFGLAVICKWKLRSIEGEAAARTVLR